MLGISCRQLKKCRLPQVDAIIIEADGSQGLPLKFPGIHEPVICSPETLVVPVAGICPGAKVGEGNFQRLPLACRYLGLRAGK